MDEKPAFVFPQFVSVKMPHVHRSCSWWCLTSVFAFPRDALKVWKNLKSCHRSPLPKNQILKDMRVLSVIIARCVPSSGLDSNVPAVRMWVFVSYATKNVWKSISQGIDFLLWSLCLGCQQMPVRSWRRGKKLRRSSKRRKMKRWELTCRVTKTKALGPMPDSGWRAISRNTFLPSCRFILRHLYSHWMHQK